MPRIWDLVWMKSCTKWAIAMSHSGWCSSQNIKLSSQRLGFKCPLCRQSSMDGLGAVTRRFPQPNLPHKPAVRIKWWRWKPLCWLNLLGGNELDRKWKQLFFQSVGSAGGTDSVILLTIAFSCLWLCYMALHTCLQPLTSPFWGSQLWWILGEGAGRGKNQSLTLSFV